MLRRIVLLGLLGGLLLVAGCEVRGSGETADAHDVTLPLGAEAHLPLPADASIMTTTEAGGTHVVLFRPGLNWPESLEFFSTELAASQWTLVRQSIPERAQGERTAEWEIEGHGVRATIDLTAFGGAKGTNLTGSIMVNELSGSD